jgi:hypothetical protein
MCGPVEVSHTTSGLGVGPRASGRPWLSIAARLCARAPVPYLRRPVKPLALAPAPSLTYQPLCATLPSTRPPPPYDGPKPRVVWLTSNA